MLTILLFTVTWGACLARSNEYYSYSSALGRGNGNPFTSSGAGAITGVKIWEIPNQYIAGIQLRHGSRWGKVLGRIAGNQVRMDLFDGEAITQVSGKYNTYSYIYQLVFGTSKGRLLMSGQPSQNSFSYYPTHVEAELRMLSGRFNGYGITSLGAHWGMVYTKDSIDKEPREMTTAHPYSRAYH